VNFIIPYQYIDFCIRYFTRLSY